MVKMMNEKIESVDTNMKRKDDEIMKLKAELVTAETSRGAWQVAKESRWEV